MDTLSCLHMLDLFALILLFLLCKVGALRFLGADDIPVLARIGQHPRHSAEPTVAPKTSLCHFSFLKLPGCGVR